MKSIKLICLFFVALVTQKVTHGMDCPMQEVAKQAPVMAIIFKEVAQAGVSGACKNPLSISLVCKKWYKIIHGKERPNSENKIGFSSLGDFGKNIVMTWYGVTDKNRHIAERFLNGKIVYKNEKENIEREWNVIDLENPFKGRFNFDIFEKMDGEESQIFDFCINVGFIEEARRQSNKNEVWLSPRFLIERYIETSAQHLKGVMRRWDENKAPLGIFWNYSHQNLKTFRYLTSANLEKISSNSLIFLAICSEKSNLSNIDKVLHAMLYRFKFVL